MTTSAAPGLVAVLVAAAVAVGGVATMPPPDRISRLVPGSRARRVRPRIGVGATADRLLGHIGRSFRRAAGRTAAPALDRRWGVVAVSAAAALASPALAVVVATTCQLGPRLLRRAVRQRAEAAIRSALPEGVDLIRLGVDAGLTPGLAIAEAAAWIPSPLGPALARVVTEAGSGCPVTDALGRLPDDLGDQVRPLVAAVMATERDGAPLGPTLERLAAEVRRDRRRRAEEAARRLPVKLLFPLVLCALPAFALLTLVPLVAGVLSSLRL